MGTSPLDPMKNYLEKLFLEKLNALSADEKPELEKRINKVLDKY